VAGIVPLYQPVRPPTSTRGVLGNPRLPLRIGGVYGKGAAAPRNSRQLRAIESQVTSDMGGEEWQWKSDVQWTPSAGRVEESQGHLVHLAMNECIDLIECSFANSYFGRTFHYIKDGTFHFTYDSPIRQHAPSVSCIIEPR
jgi:hypothetical protein